MGVRLKYEGNSEYNDEYEIHIIDSDYSGSVIPFDCYLQDANIRVNGASKDRLNIINTGEFSFKMFLRNADHEAFFYDLALQQEGRFFIHCYLKNKNAASGVFEPIFIGNLVVDEVFLENKIDPTIEIVASDGLNRLTDQEFKIDSDGTPIVDKYGEDTYFYEGKATILEMIMLCLQGVGTIDEYPTTSANNRFLVINHHWYESNHAVMTKSPFEMIRVDHSLFTKRDDEGNYSTRKRSEVLKSILTAFGCTIRYVFGTYYIENFNEKAKDTKTIFEYDKDGSFIQKTTNSNWFYSLAHPFTDRTAPHVLEGGRFGFIPPIKEASVTLSYQLSSFGYVPNYWNTDETSLVALGDLKVTNEFTSLFIGWGIEFKYDFIVPGSDHSNSYLVFWFALTVKFGTWYYVSTQEEKTYTYYDIDGDEHTGTFIEYINEWTETPGTFLILSDIIRNPGVWILEKNEFTFPAFESVDGIEIDDVEELSVKIEYVKATTVDERTEVSTEVDVLFRTVGFYVTILEEGERIGEQDIAIKYTTNYSDKNSTIIELDTLIGDSAFNSNNRIEIDEVGDGSSWVQSGALWGVNTFAGTLKLQELLLSELVAGQPYTLRRYQGSFKSMRDMRYFLKYDGVSFIPLEMTYNLMSSVWDGEFIHAVNAPQTLTITSSGVQADNSGTITSNVGATDNNSVPQTVQTIFPFEFPGAGSVDILFGDIPLPATGDLTRGQVDYLVQVFRNNLRCWYGENSVQGYTIDNVSNKIVMSRALRVGEVLKGYIVKIEKLT